MALSRRVTSFVGSGALLLAASAAAAPTGAPSASAAAPVPPASAAAPRAPAAPHAAASAARPPAPAPSATPAGTGAEDRAALAGRLVVLERAGKALELGVVLNGDGRIATALSALGDARHLDAHYADNKVVPVRLGHADKARDLALLVPANAEHKLGLKAARESAPAMHAPLGSFVSAGSKAAPGPTVTPTGPSAFNGSDGKPYHEAIAFTSPLAATSTGSPLVDSNGEVVAVVTRACQKKAGGACAPVLVGTPVGVVREFLRAAPKTAALPTASLGFQVAPEDTGTARGLRVTLVGRPAATLGLRAGNDARTADVIVALDGVPVTTLESYEHVLADHAVGDVVDLLVLGSGRYRHVTAIVSAAPHAN